MEPIPRTARNYKNAADKSPFREWIRREDASYLNAAMEDSEEMFLVALRDVAEAKQMAKVAEGAGVARESVYRMLTAKGNPTYTSLLGILHAVGLKIKIAVEGATNTP